MGVSGLALVRLLHVTLEQIGKWRASAFLILFEHHTAPHIGM